MKFGRSDYDDLFRNVVTDKIPEDEPVFLFRGTDPLVPRLLLNYATEMRLAGTDPKVADSVIAHAQRIMDWQKHHQAKHANLIHEDENTVEKKYRISELICDLEVDGKLSEDKILELQDLIEGVYGKGRFKLLMPGESIESESDDWKSNYDLVLEIERDKMIKILWVSKSIT